MGSQSLFQSSVENKTPADVAAAIVAIDAAILNQFTKTVFRDLLTGLKILIKSMQQNTSEANTIILQWLKLFLRVENALDPNDDKLRKQFEKYIPPAISYIVAALQYNPSDIPQYHLQLLDLSLRLLEKVSEKTLKEVANLESGLIACLWLPIDFVGDFNTQMAAIRLMVKLLKCVDDTKQDKELAKICSPQQRVLRDSICGAVQVANFHAGKFEKAARELLNNYNMNIAPNVLVYSIRCKSIKYDGIACFYKTVNSDYLWIDLNYCPRTLTFDARYRANNKGKYINVGVTLQIKKLKLFKKTLNVVFDAPPRLSKNITNQDKLENMRCLQFELYTDEVLRLKENQLVLEYYNATANKESSMDDKSTKTPSSSSDTTSDQSLLFTPPRNSNDKKELTEDLNRNAENDAVEQPPKEVLERNQVTRAMENFQKSYNFLIGHKEEILRLRSANSDENNQSKNTQTINEPKDSTVFNSPESNKDFKIPSLTFYENACLRAQLSQQNNKETNSSSQTKETIEQPKNIAPAYEETPKTSFINVDVRRNISQTSETLSPLKPTHTYAAVNKDSKRRFFTGLHQPLDIDASPGAKKPKLVKSSAKKRLKKYEKIFTSPPKRKQINKVKPMNHLAKSDGDPEEAVQEYVENGGIVNITNFLRNGNESAAVFNEDERRIILQNVQRINENLERTAKKFFQKNDPANGSATADGLQTIDDIYDPRNVSDAEPGQSYRNFRVRRQRMNECCEEESKPKEKKPRKNAAKAKQSAKISTSRSLEENAATTENQTKSTEVSKPKKRAPKRKAIATVTTARRVTTAPETTLPNPAPPNGIALNKTNYSQDMHMDLTCLNNNASEINKKPNSTNNENQSKQSTKSLSILEPPIKKQKISNDQMMESTKNCDKNNNTNKHLKNVTTLSPMTISESSFNQNDIQAARHNATIEQLIVDENIWHTPTLRDYKDLEKSPCLSDAMNVSDINGTPEKMTDKHNKSDASCIKTLFPKISNINDNTTNEDLPKQFSEQPLEQCIVYRHRSDSESSQSDDELTTDRSSSALMEKMYLTPKRAAVEHSFATKSVTKSTLSGVKPNLQACGVRTTSVTTRQIISQDLFFVPTTSAGESSSSKDAQHRRSTIELVESNASLVVSKLPVLSDITNSMMTYNNTFREVEVRRNPLFKDIFIILETFKENMKKEYESFQSRIKLEDFIEKITSVSKRLLQEAENERCDLEQSEKEIAKIIRQLNWHWESYQKKTENFNCFKQNIEHYLNALSEIDFESDINEEYGKLLAKLNDKGTKLSTNLWQEFVKETTDNLINNLSCFSTL